MKNVIDQLVAEMDEETRRLGSDEILYLVGHPVSRYMKGAAGRAKKLGLLTMFVRPAVRIKGFCVYDTETTEGPYNVRPLHDLDAISTPEMSCTAEALALLLCQQYGLLRGKHICIVGRGHAVQGLAEFLLMNDCTVTLCHSKTEDLLRASYGSDVLVLAAPIPAGVPVGVVGMDLVLDVSGARGPVADYIREEGSTYVSAQDIGRLNISVLLNRFVKRSKEA